MKRFEDSAVSPVVGVMLMLVVTLIIAAVVSGFAGSLGSDQATAPQASLKCTPVIESIQDDNSGNYVAENPVGFTAENGFLFEHTGGDGFALGDIAIQIQSGTTKAKISNANTINSTSECLPASVTAYIMEIGSSDGYITPGDMFMLYADNCRIDPGGSVISWYPDGAAGGFAVYLNTKCEYKIIDKTSGNVIQQGNFVLR